jgi:2-polyprenyl-3-methyl-5-hydroxy-6-metoxy-1,4-benzoquinol methylase
MNVSVDYDRVYDLEAYQVQQVQGLERSQDRAAFAHYATYRPFFRQVSPAEGNTLVDVGCGVGRFCHAAHARGWDVTGIDISEQAIETARRFASFPLYVMSLDDLVAKGERFDVVTAFEVLEHLDDPLGFARLAKRALEPGGRFFATVPNWDCDVVQNAERTDWLPPIHLSFFTQPALQRLAQEAGFKQVSTGVIQSSPLPTRPLAAARWAWRRLLGQRSSPLGLWLYARL